MDLRIVAALSATAVALPLSAGPASADPVLNGEFTVSGVGTNNQIAVGPDGNMWVTLDTGTKDVAKITPDGTVTEYESANMSNPIGITAGPDGNLWVTQAQGVARFAPADPTNATKFTIADIADPRAITTGPDGNLWTASADKVVKFPPANPAGFTSYAATGVSGARWITTSSDRYLWVADFGSAQAVRVATNGTGTAFPALGGLQGIAAGASGQVAYSQPGAAPNYVGLLTPPGPEVKAPMPGADPFGVTYGSDGAYWVAQFATNSVARVTADGQASTVALPVNSGPRQIGTGPGDTLWVTLDNTDKIARITGVTAPTVPGAPTGVVGVPGDKQVQVSWAAPANDGGATITGYTAKAAPGGATCTTSGTSCTVEGLTNGQAYTFTVKATNVAGDGPASDPAAAVTPRTTPGAPTGVVGVPGDKQVQVSWAAPANDGGATITGYTAKAAPGGATCTTSGTSCTVEGLTNGQAYTFTVKATNVAGDGPASDPAAAVTPRTTPGAPTGVVGVPGDKQVQVSWAAPANDGGATITGYTAKAAPGGATCTTSGTSCTVEGLTNGQAYTFTVKASNAAGDGPASDPADPVTPAATPPPVPVTQTASVQVPKKVKYKGTTVLLTKAVMTNAGREATSKVTVSPKGKKYSKVKTTSRGKVTIRTLGKRKLKVTLNLTAPADGHYAAYSFTKTWTVKK